MDCTSISFPGYKLIPVKIQERRVGYVLRLGMVLVAGHCCGIGCFASAEGEIHEMVGDKAEREEEPSAWEMG